MRSVSETEFCPGAGTKKKPTMSFENQKIRQMITIATKIVVVTVVLASIFQTRYFDSSKNIKEINPD
jgi:hypothetical protein